MAASSPIGFIGIGMLFGVFNSILVLIDSIKPPGLSPGNYSGVFFLGGIIGSVLQGIIVDAGWMSYKAVIKSACAVLFVVFLLHVLIWTGTAGFDWGA